MQQDIQPTMFKRVEMEFEDNVLWPAWGPREGQMADDGDDDKKDAGDANEEEDANANDEEEQ